MAVNDEQEWRALQRSLDNESAIITVLDKDTIQIVTGSETILLCKTGEWFIKG